MHTDRRENAPLHPSPPHVPLPLRLVRKLPILYNLLQLTQHLRPNHRTITPSIHLPNQTTKLRVQQIARPRGMRKSLGELVLVYGQNSAVKRLVGRVSAHGRDVAVHTVTIVQAPRNGGSHRRNIPPLVRVRAGPRILDLRRERVPLAQCMQALHTPEHGLEARIWIVVRAALVLDQHVAPSPEPLVSPMVLAHVVLSPRDAEWRPVAATAY